MLKYLYIFIASFAMFLLYNGCKESTKSQSTTVKVEYEKLSDYNFFEGNLKDLSPIDGVIPYDLTTSLFTDYAHKSRFVKLPKGQSAEFQLDKVVDFPEGTVLIKNFFYFLDERDQTLGKRIIETRLLIKKADDWETLNYKWNSEQTEAFLDIIGDIVTVDWIDSKGQSRNINYIIPNKNQCRSCHNLDGKITPIGPKVAFLNKDFAYRSGLKNQLRHWGEIGILKVLDSVEVLPEAAEWGNQKFSLHDRAMAYLDINCAHCHNAKGAANTSGLHLTVNAPMDINLGIYKATVSAGAGTGGHTYSIVPGSSSTSVMVNRMKSTNPGAMMPELGRSMVHEEGVALIAEWIDKMDKRQFTHLSTNTLQ
jgi:uncharacterized repeat protein (TIGR03806 family)